ncbi:MAG: Voltage-gated ClC-type chloride channel ClcB [Planctomycetota bacterium]
MAGPRGIPGRAFTILLLAAVVGIAGGLLGAGFQNGINWLQLQLAGKGDSLSQAVRENLSPLQVVLMPTVGGILAGGVLLLLRRRQAPFGIADIIGLVALRSGTIRLRDSFLQIVSSACTIGSGGSIGREGANSQIAATVAALLARVTGANSRTRAVLLGCGVAAGMACSYNSPIAGAIFVMEVVLGNFAMDVFAPVVVASVLATMLRQALIADTAVYGAGLPAELNPLSWDLIFAALLLGVVCGVGSLAFRGSLKWGRKLFTTWRMPAPVSLGLGGLAVGIIGLWLPETWGNGFEVITTITDATATPAIGLVLSLFVWKVAATVFTVGSGGLGGIFTPNLVVGAAFGALFGRAMEYLQPAATVEAARHEEITFAFVGMAGLCAALTHAPITSVVLVFELTRHYELVLPLMLCCITASVVARMLNDDSYYSESLRAKGQEVPEGLEELALRRTYVRDVMRTDTVSVLEQASFDDIMSRFAGHRGETLYVTDEENQLRGRIDLHDLKNFINDPTLSSVVIATDVSRPARSVGPDDSLADLLPTFESADSSELAVCTGSPPRLVGRVTRQDVLAGISDEVLGGQRRARFRAGGDKPSTLLELPEGWDVRQVPVPDAWEGLALDALPLGPGREVNILMLVRRIDDGTLERQPATPQSVLQPGWEIVVIGSRKALDALGSSASET